MILFFNYLHTARFFESRLTYLFTAKCRKSMPCILQPKTKHLALKKIFAGKYIPHHEMFINDALDG